MLGKRKKLRKNNKGGFILDEGTFYGIPFVVEVNPKRPLLATVRIKRSPFIHLNKKQKEKALQAILTYLELEGFNDEPTEIH